MYITTLMLEYELLHRLIKEKKKTKKSSSIDQENKKRLRNSKEKLRGTAANCN